MFAHMPKKLLCKCPVPTRHVYSDLMKLTVLPVRWTHKHVNPPTVPSFRSIIDPHAHPSTSRTTVRTIHRSTHHHVNPRVTENFTTVLIPLSQQSMRPYIIDNFTRQPTSHSTHHHSTQSTARTVHETTHYHVTHTSTHESLHTPPQNSVFCKDSP